MGYIEQVMQWGKEFICQCRRHARDKGFDPWGAEEDDLGGKWPAPSAVIQSQEAVGGLQSMGVTHTG